MDICSSSSGRKVIEKYIQILSILFKNSSSVIEKVIFSDEWFDQSNNNIFAP